jgi:hypothetical protein
MHRLASARQAPDERGDHRGELVLQAREGQLGLLERSGPTNRSTSCGFAAGSAVAVPMRARPYDESHSHLHDGGDGVHIIWRAYFRASNSPSRNRTSARDRP